MDLGIDFGAHFQEMHEICAKVIAEQYHKALFSKGSTLKA